MKVLDQVIDWMGWPGEEDAEGQHESFATVLLTGLLTLMVLILII